MEGDKVTTRGEYLRGGMVILGRLLFPCCSIITIFNYHNYHRYYYCGDSILQDTCVSVNRSRELMLEVGLHCRSTSDYHVCGRNSHFCHTKCSS